MVLTRNQLKEMNKDDLVESFLKLQDTAGSSLQELSVTIKELKASFETKLDEITKTFEGKFDALTKQFERKFEILDTDLKLSRNTSFLLEKRVISLEQYSRRECLEIRGVPDEIEHQNLIAFLIPLFERLNVYITNENEIQACHRLKNKSDVIIKFSNRYQRNGILTNRKMLKDISGEDKEDLGLNPNGDVFINESLSPYNRKLTGIATILKKRGKLFSFWTVNGTIRFVFHENDEEFYTVTHERDFYDNFREINFEKIFDR